MGGGIPNTTRESEPRVNEAYFPTARTESRSRGCNSGDSAAEGKEGPSANGSEMALEFPTVIVQMWGA